MKLGELYVHIYYQFSYQEHGTSETYKTILSTVGFEPPTPNSFFLARPSNHSAIRAVHDMRFKLLQYIITPPVLSELCVMCKGIIKKKRINNCLFTISGFKPFKYEMIYI